MDRYTGRWRIVAAALLAGAGVAHGQQGTAAAVYASIAPAVVFVETDGGTGSGLLLESDAVLTAAHVVYPHRSARVVFPDGTELRDVLLIGWDLLTDIAVLGPVQSEVAPPPLDTTAEPAVGSDLFTIGYPGEVEPFPQPTISRGILSRYRRWPDQGITYLQTDASVDGGQSGGVLASADGTVLGMTVFTSFGHFGLAISAADLLSRVDALLAGEDPAGLGDRVWDESRESLPIRIRLSTYWSEQAFVIDAQPGAEVTFTALSRNDIALAIVDIWGETIAEADETEEDAESITATLDGTPPFLLAVEQFSADAIFVQIEGDTELTRVADPDDGSFLRVPARRVGAIDYPSDIDVYRVALSAGHSYRVRVDSALIDPYVRIDYRTAGEEDLTTDDDSGGGLFGLNAELVYRAERTRTYYVVVEDATDAAIGGYTLTIEPEES